MMLWLTAFATYTRFILRSTAILTLNEFCSVIAFGSRMVMKPFVRPLMTVTPPSAPSETLS